MLPVSRFVYAHTNKFVLPVLVCYNGYSFTKIPVFQCADKLSSLYWFWFIILIRYSMKFQCAVVVLNNLCVAYPTVCCKHFSYSMICLLISSA